MDSARLVELEELAERLRLAHQHRGPVTLFDPAASALSEALGEVRRLQAALDRVRSIIPTGGGDEWSDGYDFCRADALAALGGEG